MNIQELRQRVGDRTDWHAEDDEAIALFNRFLNTAVDTLIRRAPYAFWQKTRSVWLRDSANSLGATDTVTVSTDRWLCISDLVIGNPLATVWSLDGSWALRTIELTDTTTGIRYDREVRTVKGDGVNVYAALDRPIPGSATQVFTWEIFDAVVYLPSNMVLMDNCKYVSNTTGLEWDLPVINQREGDRTLNSGANGHSGSALALYRRDHRMLPVPKFVLAVIKTASTWTNSEPVGSFEYKITLVAGVDTNRPRRGVDKQSGTVATRFEPILESAPSLATTVVAVDAGLTEVVTLRLPAIEHMMGFTAGLRGSLDLSGLYLYIYRRRVKDASTERLPGSEAFHLIHTVEAGTASWEDNGSLTPDYGVPLVASHGSFTLGVYPRPSQAAELRLRVIERPSPQYDDEDVFALHAEASSWLIHQVAGDLKTAGGNPQGGAIEYKMAAKTLLEISDLYGTAAPRAQKVIRDGVKFDSGIQGLRPTYRQPLIDWTP